jgi:hypothetical protein
MKKLFVITAMFLIILPALLVAVTADAASFNAGLEYATNIGLSNRDPRAIAADVINILLGFLGIIAVIIILIGGFKWMTAGGNEDKVAEAKKLISAGVIGLVIIFASWGIATFVISSLQTIA